MFLYGMNILSAGLQKVAGNKFNNIVKSLTKNKISGIVVGAFVTAVLHSSAATTVMVVGFVNAGIMKLTEAIGVIMGANIGTTITAWIVSLTGLGDFAELLNPLLYAPLIVGVSAIYVVFARKDKIKTMGNIFVGIGFLFLGLMFMSNGVSVYAKSKVFSDAFEILGRQPILAIFAGAIVTAILSSSTASVSILQTLALAGSVSKSAACFITVGQNVGTCITTILSSINGTKNGKRAALLHLLFNVMGGLIFSIVVLVSYSWIKEYLMTKISIFEISIFHTGFNIINTILLLPLSNVMVTITKKLIPDGADEEIEVNLSEKTQSILDERILNQPSVAIGTVRKELLFYMNYTLKNLKRATSLITGDRNEELIQSVKVHENQIDKTTFILIEYLSKINRLNITDEQSYYVEHMMAVCNDVERIGDHAENLSENAAQLLVNEADFSIIGKSELENAINISVACYEDAIFAFKNMDMDAVEKVREYESRVDVIKDEYKDNHMKRMSDGKCNMISGMIFLDILGNLERITDHANNIADYVEDEKKQ